MISPNEKCKAISQQLSKICKLKGYSCYALAKKTNMSTSTMYSIMNGTTTPQLYTLFALCDVLEISILNIFDERVLGENFFVKSNQSLYELEDDLSEDEKNLLCRYRNMSDEKKNLLNIYMDMLQQYIK